MNRQFRIKKKTLYLGLEGIVFTLVNALGLFATENTFYSVALVAFLGWQLVISLYRNSPTKKDRAFLLLAILAFAIRIFIMYYDVAITEIDSGDSRDFREWAHFFYYTNEPLFRGEFATTTIWLGAVCKVFGPQRIMPQFFGIILFIKSADYTYRLLKKLKINEKGATLIVSWMLFTPQNIKATSISNREAFVNFFVTASIYTLVTYIEKGKMKSAVYSICAAMAAASLHSGSFFIVIPILIALAFYDKNVGELKWNTKTFFWIVMIPVAIFALYAPLESILFEKFSSLDGFATLARKATVQEISGSDYRVPGEGITGPAGFLLTTPIRMIYFLISPTPEYWRGIQDVVAFTICSIPQIMIWITALKNKKKWKYMDKKVLAIYICLLLGYILIAVVFAWGCKNAGTAIRHRDKFLSMQSLLLGIGLYPMQCKIRKNAEYETEGNV